MNRFVSLGLFAVTLAACSSNPSPERPPNDAGSDAPLEPTPGERTPTALTEACAVFPAMATSCKPDDPCSRAQSANCDTFLSRYSDAFLKAIAACATTECSPTTSTCIAEHEDAIPTTPTQNRIRDAYCKICPDSCASFFDLSGTAEGKMDGMGAAVRHASDEAAARVEAECISKLTSETCGTPFFDCSYNIAENPILPECEAK